MKDFFTGFGYPYIKIKLFFSIPKIIIYSLIPFLFNSALYIYSFIFFYGKIKVYMRYLTDTYLHNTGIFESFAYYIFISLGILLLLIICYFLIVIIGGLFSAPFNEKISKIIEQKITGINSEYNPPFLKDIMISLKAESIKLIFYMSGIIILFLISFIPLIGSIISLVLGLIYSFFFNALDFLDYPMTRRYFNFRNKLKIISKKPLLTLGFGCSIFIILFLPVFNLIFKPICVVSGTAMFFEKNYSQNL